ncbi:MAG: hypothetical protein VZS44_00890 [Bacilli bacterium]|nr:hypothetical protein [Bacilli bacterium]
MDKFKNLFTDEEFIDEEEEEEEIEEPVKIKEVKKEEKKKDKLPTFMREKIEKEEKDSKKNEDTDDEVSDFKINKDLINKNIDFGNNVNNKHDDPIEELPSENLKDNSFKFPIDLDDSDFSDKSRVSRQSRNNINDSLEEHSFNPKPKVIEKTHNIEKDKKEVKVAELYKDKREDEKEKSKRFQATPIISPIYGVLDKNYRKEEIRHANGGNYELNRPSKSIDFDSVRKKAFGNEKETLADDIKNNLNCEDCDYFKNAKTCKKDLDVDDLMYEALCEKEDKVKDITLDEATENYFDYGVEYEKQVDVDSYNVDDYKVDDYKEDEFKIDEVTDVSEDVKIVNHETKPKAKPKTEKGKKKSVPPVKSSINLLSTLKKSMGNEDEEEVEEPKKELELTDDLFNLIDSMYDEGDE